MIPDKDCPRCPRLVAYRSEYRVKEPAWHNAPAAREESAVDNVRKRSGGGSGIRCCCRSRRNEIRDTSVARAGRGSYQSHYTSGRETAKRRRGEQTDYNYSIAGEDVRQCCVVRRHPTRHARSAIGPSLGLPLCHSVICRQLNRYFRPNTAWA